MQTRSRQARGPAPSRLSKSAKHARKVQSWLMATKNAKFISAGVLFGAGVVALVFGGAVFFDYTLGSTQRMNGAVAVLVPAVVALLVAAAARSTSRKVQRSSEEDEDTGRDATPRQHSESLDALAGLQSRAALVIIMAGVAGILNAALTAGCGDADRAAMSKVAWSVALSMAGLVAVGPVVAQVGELVLTQVLCSQRTQAPTPMMAKRLSMLIVALSILLVVGACLAITRVIDPVTDSADWLGSTWGITGAAGLAWLVTANVKAPKGYSAAGSGDDAAGAKTSALVNGELPTQLRNGARFLFLGCVVGATLITGMTTHTAATTPVVLPVLAVFIATEAGVRTAARVIVRVVGKVEHAAFSDSIEELTWTMSSPLLAWVALLAGATLLIGLMTLASLFGWITLEASTWIWLPPALAGLGAVVLLEVGCLVKSLRASNAVGDKLMPRAITDVTISACMVITFAMVGFAAFLTSRTHDGAESLEAALQGHLVLLVSSAACAWELSLAAFQGGLSLLQARIAAVDTSKAAEEDN